MRTWGFIPARGGSKNMRLVNGRPLIDYCVERALKAKHLERIYCSSDSRDLLYYIGNKYIYGDLRPKSVSDPDEPVDNVVKEFLLRDRVAPNPQAICLIQPTSPFFNPEHISTLINILEKNKVAQSTQTICKVPHNFHAWNQRSYDFYKNAYVKFIFPDLRATGYNKQHKPTLYKFGNLVITRVDALLKGETFFAQPSIGFPIGWKEALDVDTEDDFELMKMILNEEER